VLNHFLLGTHCRVFIEGLTVGWSSSASHISANDLEGSFVNPAFGYVQKRQNDLTLAQLLPQMFEPKRHLIALLQFSCIGAFRRMPCNVGYRAYFLNLKC
jgi:hypothetical protein